MNATFERVANDVHSNERSEQLVVLGAVVIYETCKIIKVVTQYLKVGNFGGAMVEDRVFELR
jgi:hypothetical protein